VDLAEDHDVVQALPPKRTTDMSLRVGVLPWRCHRRYHLLDAEDLQDATETGAVDLVSV
jgi:hypothetical protein